MVGKLKNFYRNSSLATKIRYSYLLIVIPMLIFILLCVNYLSSYNKEYDAMVDSAVAASKFSMNFKSDFDYKIYLIVVGNKTYEQSNPIADIEEAKGIIESLKRARGSRKNLERIQGIEKYLNNLEEYTRRIRENQIKGDCYDQNIEIWENDVQIVTSLIRDSVLEYIYYETREIETARADAQLMYYGFIKMGVLIMLGISTLLALLSFYIPRSITRPIRELCQVTDQVARGNLEVRSNLQEGMDIRVLSESLNIMIFKIQELLDTVKREQINLREAELELLQSQINPHFLYNTLDTIVWLAESGDQKQVVRMIGSLSSFFRISLSQGSDMVTVEKELTHVASYLQIQQVRYQDILEYEIHVPEQLNPYQIPKITLQPLVENALYHGIKNKRRKGKIEITGEKLSDHIELRVKDNGIGMEQELLERLKQELNDHDVKREKKFFGLSNVNERIRLKCGEQYGLRIYSISGEGTEICVRLPIQV